MTKLMKAAMTTLSIRARSGQYFGPYHWYLYHHI